MRRILGAVALAGILIVALVPPVLGLLAHGGYHALSRDLIAALPDPGVIENRYEAGWFSSRATLELAMELEGVMERGPLLMRLDTVLEQGPLAWLPPSFPPRFARLHSELKLAGLPIEVPPLMLTSDLMADRSIRVELAAPAFETIATDDSWGLAVSPSTGTLHGSFEGSRILAGFQIPALRLLGSAVARAEGVERAEPLEWDEVVHLSDIRFDVEQVRGDQGHPERTARLALARGRFGEGPPESPALALEGTRLELRQWAEPTAPTDLVTLRLRLESERIVTPDHSLSQATLGLALERLDAAALAQWFQELAVLRASGVAPELRGQMALGMLAAMIPRWTREGLRLELAPVHAETPQGLISGRLDLGLDDAVAPSPWPGWRPLAWLSQLRGQGELELPEDFLLDGGRQPETGSDGRAAIRAPIAAWVADGWITRDAGQLRSAWRLGDGLLTVNGKTVPLP
ncbi:hypothetical protein CKO25_05840 [Thiocapsa imhoffii]|uniref:DUF945 family protein n=1 Tax=Thiocapsa imhoffii TaxID=382777 RepID=A0A9X0WHG4_9GAMM|nr:DUF945 family protein [Thiocapsa imhoffii]MBK1644182.1 hypothetical protein [Thiocapsa imhoffii]